MRLYPQWQAYLRQYQLSVLIVVAESDILHDEGTAYGRKLDEAGVEVTTMQYNGIIHDFGLLNGLAELPETRSLFVQAAAQLKKYLQ
ncbi:alpha/beta hydrolase fold domain-containing protein [Nostoc sp. FACHB-145]|uniref:alpha/beta hydrolase n=1 Tax=Nostoc sp. FACHB-145 TaxID=2692836 RepID=UPI0028C39FE8|nr:alpha/beta hydrolase fold domain-containing protein [Nostoc sp. FACHB-145]